MFTYIYTQNPPLFTFSLSEPRESQFSNELIAICSAEDTELLERPNYQPSRAAAAVLSAQNQTRIVALRQAAISECCCCYFLEISTRCSLIFNDFKSLLSHFPYGIGVKLPNKSK